MKLIKRSCVFLLIVLLLVITLARVQGSATPASITMTRALETDALPHEYKDVPIVAITDPRDSHRGFPARDKSNLWKVHLALQLVKRPALNGPQMQIILDAISLSTPEFFETSNDPFEKRSKADEALQSLRQRALDAFPTDVATELFANIAGEKADEDILKMYYDLSALPLPKMKATFSKASATNKSYFWRTHLALVLVKRPELNESQRKVILAAISLARSAYFEIRSADPSGQTKEGELLGSLEKRIVAAFSLEDRARIFATLGDDTKSENDIAASYSCLVLPTSWDYKLLSRSSSYEQWSHTFAGQDKEKPKDPSQDKGKQKDPGQDKGKDGAIEQELKPCYCSTQSDYCPLWNFCASGSCKATDQGCGTLWSHPCNGLCR